MAKLNICCVHKLLYIFTLSQAAPSPFAILTEGMGCLQKTTSSCSLGLHNIYIYSRGKQLNKFRTLCLQLLLGLANACLPFPPKL